MLRENQREHRESDKEYRKQLYAKFLKYIEDQRPERLLLNSNQLLEAAKRLGLDIETETAWFSDRNFPTIVINLEARRTLPLGREQEMIWFQPWYIPGRHQINYLPVLDTGLYGSKKDSLNLRTSTVLRKLIMVIDPHLLPGVIKVPDEFCELFEKISSDGQLFRVVGGKYIGTGSIPKSGETVRDVFVTDNKNEVVEIEKWESEALSNEYGPISDTDQSVLIFNEGTSIRRPYPQEKTGHFLHVDSHEYVICGVATINEILTMKQFKERFISH